VPIGYSDHTQGIEIALAAAALGAVVLEKHFTLDRTMDGPDHKASIEVQELKALVDGVRKIERALGNGIKQPSPSERKNISIVRKSIVAACDIKAGEIFTDKNLACKRPGDGISPMNWYSVLGKKAKYDFAEDELIKL
ncbi:SAF domain protein, partial [Treponema socranskii subsp. socranskii VPI DR56BR1116 = ATCC 35536]